MEAPVQRQRPYNPETDYTIRVGESKIKLFGMLPIGSSHLVITGHDPSGRQLWEINGFPTDANNQRKRKAAGSFFDPDDKIKVNFSLGQDEEGHGIHATNQRAVRWGSVDEINDYLAKLRQAEDDINFRGLDYLVDRQNSNSAVWTLLEAIGVNPRILYRYGGFKGNVPGYSRNLLGEAIE